VSAGELTFLSHARSGLAQLTGAPAAASALRGTINLSVGLQGGGSEAVALSPYGPGDVTGIDVRQIIRTEPKPDTDNFPPNLFPFAEFDRPDFPWLFTPLAASSGRLAPWLVLVVVRDGGGNEVSFEPEVHPLPKLTVAKVDEDLPDLAESWAWAHTQVTGSLNGPLETLDAAHAERTLSRLLCPRRLLPATRYIACLVPAHRAGAEAGLGKTPTPGLDPAWTRGAGAAGLELPVYHHWRFGTGPAGDFESLARLLEPRPASGIGGRPMDASRPGMGLPSAGRRRVLEGALKAPGARPRPRPSSFGPALTRIIDAATPQTGSGTSSHVLAPPFYGRWPRAVASLAAAPPWLRELNLDPANRVAAGLGADVVREEQETLMAAAWSQVGELLAARELLRRGQLARGATASALERHADPMAHGAFLSVAAPALGRVLDPAATSSGQRQTLLARVRGSALPERALSGAFRRVVRPAGPLVRRDGGAAARRAGGLLTLLNRTLSPLAPARRLPHGAQTHPDLDALDPALRGGPAPGFQLHDEHGEPAGDPSLFRQASIALLGGLAQMRSRPEPQPAPLDLRATRVAARAALDPEMTVPARVGSRLSGVDPAWKPEDPLEPLMAAPVFPAPMFEPLGRRSPEWVAPGLSQFPANSVTVLETNNRFVNSYMVGLNHEMAAELLWRGYPVDQRGTFFRQFWDPSTRVPPTAETSTPDLRDLPALDAWPDSRPLSRGQGAAAEGKIVLVLRGELLRRYPNATIYAAAATNASPPGLGSDELYPAFRTTLDPDITLLGFDLTVAAAKGPPGWFLVLQEQPTEPAFGLEVERAGVFASSATSLSDISWGELVANQNALEALTHAAAVAPAAWPAPAQGAAGWGTDSADMATLTLQESARVAIHAKHLLP
jgi:hypothetical protein